MTDPVREEMQDLVINFADCSDGSYSHNDFITDLLRVIRGHMEGRWLNFEKDSREYRLVADYAFHQTLESLPEK